MIEVADETQLQAQLKAKPNVLVLFHASWCPFCRNFMKTFNQYAAQPDALNTITVRIDEDENPLWATYELEAVPSLVLFENGAVARRLDCNLGMGLTEQQFTQWLKTPKS